jgi:hypothetical protein
MTGLVRKATLMAVCGLFAAATASANVPSPGNSEYPLWIPIVTTTSGVPYPGKSVTYVIRDFTNNPIAGSIVEVDFTGCSDLKICNAQTAPATINCGVFGKKIRATTNAAGSVTFTVVGASINTGNGGAGTPGCGLNGVVVRADGVLFPNASSWVYDQNGALGAPVGSTLSGTDLSVLGVDVSRYSIPPNPYVARGDINQSGTLSGTDLSLLGVAVSQSSVSPFTGSTNCLATSTYCP